MKRKYRLIEEVKDLSIYRFGHKKTSSNTKVRLLNVVEDMAKLRIMPERLKDIDEKIVLQLINHWSFCKKFEGSTIGNYISDLRKVPGINIPNRSCFGVSAKRKKNKSIVYLNEDIIDLDISKRLKIALLLQKNLPIHASEAEQFPGILVENNRITIPKKISFNGKTRQINIAGDSNHELKLVSEYLSKNDDYTYYIDKSCLHTCFLTEISIALKKKIKNYSLQHLYIKKRLEQLGKSRQSLIIIKEEFGFSRTAQVEDILNGS